MYKVYCPEMIEKKGYDFLLEHGYEVQVGTSVDKEELIRMVADADAAVVRYGSTFDADVLAAGKRLKIVARHGVGYNNIDVEAAAALGIYVTNAKASNANAVAEHALTMMLMLAKQIPRYKNTLTEGHWNDRNEKKTEEVYGKTLGIIGFGANGSRLGSKAHGIGMKVICYDPYIDYTKIPDYVEGMMRAEDVFSRADVISMHCVLNEETHHYIRKRELEMMKPSAYVINCARGGLICEDDLYHALTEGKIAGAALDVFETEPPSRENPLFKLNNFYGTLHQAGMTVTASDACALYAVQSIHDVLQGREPKYPVNQPDRKKFEERMEKR